jgi:hypothetical protein
MEKGRRKETNEKQTHYQTERRFEMDGPETRGQRGTYTSICRRGRETTERCRQYGDNREGASKEGMEGFDRRRGDCHSEVRGKSLGKVKACTLLSK